MYRFTCVRFEDMDAQALMELGRFRHAVFIRRLGWDVVSTHNDFGMEFDQFDSVGTTYVLAYNAKNSIVGCTRLLPTTRPFLLGEVFPDLCSRPIQSHPRVWEISRYAALGNGSLGIELFKASIQSANRLGAKDVVAVTNCSLERYFRMQGVLQSRLGLPKADGAQKLVALEFPANQFSKTALDCSGITGQSARRAILPNGSQINAYGQVGIQA